MVCISAVAIFSSLLVVSGVFAAPAKEIAARQAGNAGLLCTLDRLSIILELDEMQGTLKNLTQEFSKSDPTSASNVKTAIDSITGAQGAVGVIIQAITAGQQPPAAARTQVEGNLTAAHDALTSINTTDTTASATLMTALTELSDAGAAGNGVLDNCN
ncbi:hypothetical protein PYCCODRAFT_1433043 [Trametes coccinea BRFM310]|uniref:Hydrophobic surface binding protein A n=1 Tax=Trametes coccinea (strain BRFM310) TaxID=1353009 RepID=A0A1Y2IUF6_TRAC3|nr:hypothetical protein PYCCODRAFT_1433043 [Trametes coccinea BRFM310]